MSLVDALPYLEPDDNFQSALEAIHAKQSIRIACGQAAFPYIAGYLAQYAAGVVVITPSDRAAFELHNQLHDFVAPQDMAVFPAWETLPHERLSPSGDTVGTRMVVLRRLAHPEESSQIRILIAPVRAVIQPIVSGLGNLDPLTLVTGADAPMTEVVRQLINLGFERVDLVDRRGHVAVRGGIIDIFPADAAHPVRIEFWGDTVEEIREFSVADQRSMGSAIDTVVISACRELMITPEVQQRAAQLLTQHPELADLLGRIAEGIPVDGMESLIPALVPQMETLLDVVPSTWAIIEVEPERIEQRADELERTSEEFLEASWHNATAGNATPIDFGGTGFRHYKDLAHDYSSRMWCSLSTLSRDDDLKLGIEPTKEYRSRINDVISDIRSWWADGNDVVVVMAGHGSAERLVTTLNDADIPATMSDTRVAKERVVQVTVGRQIRGVHFLSAQSVVLTEVDLFGTRDVARESRTMPSRRRTTLDPLQLKSGDYIVHEQHGVGKYLEMTQRHVQGATREYLVIEYAASKRGHPPDRLYVPSDQLDLITKYVGGEAPSLNKLGGGDWAATKSRARKHVRQIAGELIRLYAARMASKGHAFAPDTPWQRELEDAFEFVETPDQLATINDVKRDMESTVPMDRLVCGDVGYGKTEIAVRAAFKAAQDGKQVAILVPTTLLVQQHKETFTRRYAQFPVKVATLSRFQTDAEARDVIAGIQDGSVDVAIGTHRLFNPEVRFKDLGLVIVDEEQRFGVEHKEHLKALRANVDMLTMSATPIPRTLEMAITGLREMSTIQTPPEERHPILTSVGPYDEKYVTAAIHRELIRDGQVFFVHNRVESINRVASRLSELVPEARIAVAHGQMNEHQLEQIIVDFWERRYDVLVSTTIIESGLDIPNANTLIVDRADTFGLSQLHQLRGRVGRSRERGYAYFLYQPDRPLSETAYDRRSTIAAHTDLGSGMAVAMKDLEIRGAGNLLGGEQSGHIAEVGFDLYVRLVGEAVDEIRSGPISDQDQVAVKVELPIEAHLPHDYIMEERLRLEAYRRLADARSIEAVGEAVAELTDRYGPLPQPVEALVSIARLRVHLISYGIHEVIAAGKAVRLSPVELPESRTLRLSRLYPGSIIKPATRTIIVPRPQQTMLGSPELETSSVELVDWVTQLVTTVCT